VNRQLAAVVMLELEASKLALAQSETEKQEQGHSVPLARRGGQELGDIPVAIPLSVCLLSDPSPRSAG
jgi:hypothetical protein